MCFNIQQPYLSSQNIPVTTTILILPQEVSDSLPIFFYTLVEPKSHNQDQTALYETPRANPFLKLVITQSLWEAALTTLFKDKVIPVQNSEQ